MSENLNDYVTWEGHQMNRRPGKVEDGIAYGAPKEEAWLSAFGLTLTLVWIYLEFLRLVAILQGDN